MKQKTPRPSAVYLASFDDGSGNRYVKIGKSNAPLRRLEALYAGCPFELSEIQYMFLPSERLAYKAETAMHKAFAGYCVRREWFLVKADDEIGARRLDVEPREIAANVAKGPVQVHTMSTMVARKAYRYFDAAKELRRRVRKAA